MKIINIIIWVCLLLGFISNAFAENVTLYSYRQPFLLKPLLSAFEEKTGIKTEVLFLKTGLKERLESEGKLSPADLVLTADIRRLTQLAQSNLLQPVKSPLLKSFVPAELRHPQDLWFALSMRARVIYASKKNVPKNAIQNYQDLASPKWRGKICTRSGKHIYNLGLIATLIAENGVSKTKDWLLAVKKNLARKPQGNDRAQVKAIYAKECDVSLGNSYYLGVMATNTKDQAQQKWANAVYPITPNQNKKGTSINISGIALTKNAPNKKEAIALMEFLVSKKAQEIYAGTNHEFPIREDIKLSDFSQEKFGSFKKNLKGISEIPIYYQEASDLVDEIRFDF
jgi:iron(III) transport system substrate-binding protein